MAEGPCEIAFALADGRRLLRCGSQRYVDYPFPALLQSVNEAIDISSPLFPVLAVEPGPPERLRYALARAGIVERASLRTRPLPRACLRQLQEAIDCLHAWAEDPQVPRGTQDFCRTFALPDPVLDPEAYQLSRGPGGWRVHILWGYESHEAPAIKPHSARSAHWPDSAERVSLDERFRKAQSRFALPWGVYVRRLLVCLFIVLFGSVLWHYTLKGVAQLRAYRESTWVRLEAMQQALDEAQTSFVAVQSRCETLQRDLEAACSQRQAAEWRVKTVLEEQETIRSRASALQDALVAAQSNQQAAEGQVTTLQEELEALKERYADRESTWVRLKAMQQALDEAQTSFIAVQSRCETLQRDLEAACSQRQAAEWRVKTLLEEQETIRSRVSALQDALVAAQSSQQAAEGQVTTLQEELEALKERYAKQVRLVKQWHAKATRLEQQNKQLQEVKVRSQTLEADLKQAQQQSEHYRRICETLIGILRRADSNFAEVRNFQELDAYLSKKEGRWWEFWKKSEGVAR